jgi:hypothetical protein
MNTIGPFLSLHRIKFGKKELFAAKEFFQMIAIQEGLSLSWAAAVEGVKPCRQMSSLRKAGRL